MTQEERLEVVGPSLELKVEALYDCWAFFQLIGYQGGIKSFDWCSLPPSYTSLVG
jgi:hypothetical protein